MQTKSMMVAAQSMTIALAFMRVTRSRTVQCAAQQRVSYISECTVHADPCAPQDDPNLTLLSTIHCCK
jgi:hypothetical protein